MSGKTELLLFDESSPQVVVESASFVDVYPVNSIGTNDTKIEFIIHGSESEYLDLNDTLLYVKYLVRAGSNANASIATTSTLVPSNFFLNSLFNDVTLELNDTIIEGGSQLYAYKSTIETLFGFNRDAKEIKLKAMGYSEDENERKKWIEKSRTNELAGSIRLDFFNQPKYLLPKVDVRIIFNRSKNTFSFSGGGTATPYIVIKEACLFVRRVRVSKDVMLAHEKGLEKKNAVYPYNRGKVVTYSIPTGSMSHYRDNIFSTSLLPKLIIVGMVKASAFTGNDLDDKPFKFEHFNVQSVGLYRDGQCMPYRQPYQPHFDASMPLTTREYVKSIIQNTQQLNTNLNNGITLNDFTSGNYTFFTFNLTPDFDYNQTQLAKDGNLRLEIKFASATTEAINVIVYGLFDTQLQITKNREIKNVNFY